MASGVAARAVQIGGRAVGAVASGTRAVATRLGPEGRLLTAAAALGLATPIALNATKGLYNDQRSLGKTIAGAGAFAATIGVGVLAQRHLYGTPQQVGRYGSQLRIAGAALAGSAGAFVGFSLLGKQYVDRSPSRYGVISQSNRCIVYAPDGSNRKKAICDVRSKPGAGSGRAPAADASSPPPQHSGQIAPGQPEIVWAPDGSGRKKAIPGRRGG